MYRFPSLLRIGFVAWLGLFTPGLSADEHTHIQHDAHEHGAAQLNLALEKQHLMMELKLSAMDVLGFEHAPHDDTQKAQVDKALQQLQNAAALFTPDSAANCQAESADAERHALQHEAEAHDQDEKAYHDHDETDKHETDEHAHDEHKAEEKRHAEFHARYAFRCANPEALEGLDIHVFTQFPSVKKLQMQAVTDRGQTALQLNPQQTYVNLP